MVDPLVDALDAIIAVFCEDHGGFDYAMPMVRKQVEAVGMDFHKPTVREMEELIDRLTNISKDIKGSDFARKERMKLISILRKAERGEPID
jgi:hypothetical protein